ncbi:unannotated protein [freshwater metagenome]|uniref:Unannotated protein n=1 Tax=freshwater metagenome TaxID=449393 RepID=A0A6J7IK68_9ZZZZ|nr:rod shape-determining protein MreD [Actinomycetota bacterium]
MILDVRQLAWRMILLGGACVIVQIAAISQVTIFGAHVDLTPIVVAFAGLLCGSLAGAVFGFGVGLFLDLALVQPVGMTALLFLALGYAAGRLRELRDPQSAVVPVAVAAAATAGAEIGFSVMSFLLGRDAPVGFDLLGEIVVTILLNAAVAIPVHGVVRRWLSRALPEDPRRRRRRAYTTGGLSPLSRP